MDDSERSYGYSRDIYHGRRGPGGHYGPRLGGEGWGRFYPDQEHWEESYEYGPEQGMGDVQDGDVSPEEAAVRIRGRGPRGPEPRPGGPSYDHARGSEYAGGDSWTWDVAGPHRGVGPKGYQRSDERILEEICDRLSAHGRLDPRGVTVTVKRGEVTLDGEVGDRRSKRLAERVAESVRGVVDVHNRLHLAGRRGGGDEEAAEGGAES
ncbi:MAG TPA: BON domain-containing protein [Thermoanaerobaculia bacterium]|nr:BON domain-containing protein [Thermoanaerobaculia bacterium]